MVQRHFLVGYGGVFLILTNALGCGSTTPPVAETPPPPVSVSQPLVRDVIDHDDYEGRIAAAKEVEVRARVRGHLKTVNFQDGQMVKEGELLYEIDPRPYEASLDAAKAQKASADANLELAKVEYARTESLVKSKAVSETELQVWKAKEGTAAAEVQRALAAIEQAKLDVDFAKVVAPITGKISRTQVTVGNLVNAGGGETLLTTIVSVDPMYVYFDVDERALLRYRQHFRRGMEGGVEGGVDGGKKESGAQPSVKDLKIPVSVALEGEENYPHQGVIDFADNRVNPSTGTIQVRGVLPNTERILDVGMRARVRVPVSDPHKALMITERAIGTDQGRKFVYVVNGQNVAERRDAKLGRLSDGLVVIPEGLKPEDWVIVNGIQRVRDGAKVEPKRISMPGRK